LTSANGVVAQLTTELTEPIEKAYEKKEKLCNYFISHSFSIISVISVVDLCNKAASHLYVIFDAL